MKALLLFFEVVSGLKVYFLKSEMSGVGLEHEQVLHLAEVLGCIAGSLSTTYLGLPLCLGSSSKTLWNLVVERVEWRLAGWKEKFLSVGGRIILIQAVLSNLPEYFMSLYRCPMSIVNRLEKLRRVFFMAGERIQEVPFG